MDVPRVPRTCDRLVKAFGRERPVDDLVADDFQDLRAQVAKKWGSTA